MYFMKSHLGKVWKIFVTFIRQIITKFRDGVFEIDILSVFAVGNENRRGEQSFAAKRRRKVRKVVRRRRLNIGKCVEGGG